jgi:hypothetical protein
VTVIAAIEDLRPAVDAIVPAEDWRLAASDTGAGAISYFLALGGTTRGMILNVVSCVSLKPPIQ